MARLLTFILLLIPTLALSCGTPAAPEPDSHKTKSAYPVGAVSGDLTGALPAPQVASMTGATTAASTGIIRLPNNTAIKARNAGNSADINVCSTDNSNNLLVGDLTQVAQLGLESSNTTFIEGGGSAEILVTTGGAEILPAGSITEVITASGHEFSSSSTSFGSGTGVIGVGNASALFTAVTSGGGAIAHDSIGLHYDGPSTSFNDYMLAPSQQGTANSQIEKSRLYSGVARTTTNSAITILTIPCATSGSVCSMFVTCSGRDVTAGTVGDSFTYENAVGFKNVSGTVTGATVQGTALNAHDTSMATVAVSYTVSGTNVLVQVTGLTSTTIDYTAEARVITN